MNIICSGSRYQVYNTDDIKTYSQLPVGTYEVCFNKNIGFYLTSHNDLEVKEEKIYGTAMNRIDKVLKSFEISERNFGVILSGNKGSGKSLFARELSKKCLAKELPVILVNIAVPGIANFLSSIDQEVMILFDEFEKTFSFENDCGDKSELPQEELLSLFDGLDGGKKLFIITCNEVWRLSNYLKNRPGRFHYHFHLGTVEPDDIREYMNDKLLPQYHNQIEELVNMNYFVDMTYDLLRAIVFDLNQGYDLKSTLADLNIENKRDLSVNIVLTLKDGTVYTSENSCIDIDRTRQCLRVRHGGSGHGIDIVFDTENMTIKNREIIVDKYQLDYSANYFKEHNINPEVKDMVITVVDEVSFDFMKAYMV